MKRRFLGYKEDNSCDFIEPEIVEDFSCKKQKIFYNLFFSFRKFFILALVFWIILSLSFVVFGFILATTVVGLIIAIPAILLGFIGFFIAFKVLRFLIRFNLV